MTTAPGTGAAAVDDIVETMGERVRRTFGGYHGVLPLNVRSAIHACQPWG